MSWQRRAVAFTAFVRSDRWGTVAASMPDDERRLDFIN
jgi:hypothetical protein